MSVLFLDGFDHYVILDEKWDAQFFGGNIKPVSTQGRFTPGALQVQGSGGGGNVTKNLKLSIEVIAGFAFNNLNADSRTINFFFIDDTGAKANLNIDTTGGVGTLTYNGHTLTTPPNTFTGSVWQHIEMRIKQHPSLGELEIRRNGSTVASLSNLDTIPGASLGFISFSVEATNNAQLHFVDDLYIFDTLGTTNNTFAGDTRITVLRPNGNGLDNDFTPTGAGTNFEAVDDDLHDGDATFVEAGQIGAKETYTQVNFSDLGISPGTVFCTQVVNAAQKTDAGQLKYKDQITIGGIQFDNGVEVIATSGTYQMTFLLNDVDPSDGQPWTEAKTDAIGSGLEIVFREV